jgi:uncharacterized protein
MMGRAEEGIEGITIGGDTLYAALQAGSAALQARVAEVNALNVFPVPDGDTGTNMSLTLRAALDEVGPGQQRSASEVLRKVSQGALMGARGNSGVILSQILRGFARGLDDKAEATPGDIVTALHEGADTAYKGVMKPVEGTILTVIRESAEMAASAFGQAPSAFALMEAILREARASLARTPQLLPVLAEAGVVDAGGQGLVCILEGVVAYAHGEGVGSQDAALTVEAELAVEPHAHPPSEEEYGFDVQCIIKGQALDVDALRDKIATMGDSVLVVGDSSAVKVHVHSDHPGEVIEYAIEQGDVTSIIIENMQLQYQEFMRAHQEQPVEPPAPAPAGLPSDRVARYLSEAGQAAQISVVTVASGEGLSRIFESLGADAVVPGGQTMNPSTQDLLAAIEGVANNQVIVLPNNSNIILTAEQARALADKRVRVIPTKTVPQGISALLAFNYQTGLDENHAAMSAASQAVVTIEITQAVRTVQVNGLAVQEGQYIGLLDGDLKTAGDEILPVLEALLGSLALDEFEILTVYCGEDVPLEQGQALTDALQAMAPNLEYEVLDGGQAHYHYIISLE